MKTTTTAAATTTTTTAAAAERTPFISKSRLLFFVENTWHVQSMEIKMQSRNPPN